MAHESFEDQATAADLSKWFVSVKVDREERPDLDTVYMAATQVLTGSGGWPMSVFCTPDGRPFYAGTYFPPVERHGMPSFRRVVQALGEAWHSERDKVLEQADALVDAVRQELRLAETVSARAHASTEQQDARAHARRHGRGRQRGVRIEPRDGRSRCAAGTGGPRSLAGLRPRLGRVRAGTQIPAADPGRTLPAPRADRRLGALAADGDADTRRHGRRRHLRPSGRRLLPVFDRRALAGAALREDAAGSGLAHAGLLARVAGGRTRRLPRGRHGDAGLRTPGPVHARGRPLLLLRR